MQDFIGIMLMQREKNIINLVHVDLDFSVSAQKMYQGIHA